MALRDGTVIALTFVGFWAGLALPMAVLQVPPRETHLAITAMLAIGVGIGMAWLLPKGSPLRKRVGGSVRAWVGTVFLVSLATSVITTALVWATLRGM